MSKAVVEMQEAIVVEALSRCPEATAKHNPLTLRKAGMARHRSNTVSHHSNTVNHLSSMVSRRSSSMDHPGDTDRHSSRGVIPVDQLTRRRREGDLLNMAAMVPRRRRLLSTRILGRNDSEGIRGAYSLPRVFKDTVW